MRILKLILTMLLLGNACAQADIGMITQLDGEVVIAGSGRSTAAVPFFKFNRGDKFTLANDARLQLVYFENGRQEVWKGSGQVEAGNIESKSALKPEISMLPLLIVNQLAKTPAAGQQGKTAMIRVRTLGNADAAEQLDKQYADSKRKAAAGDTTPEIYLLSRLVELKDFARAKSVLADLSGKTGYKSVVDHFTQVVNAHEK